MAGSFLERSREVEIRRFPPNRRLVTAALRAGRRKHPMYGLLELDVTEAARLVEERRLSFTAFVIASVARAVSLHPEVQAYRDLRGRLVIHRHVDVSTIVEIPTDQGLFPLVHLVRDADVRDVADITNELHKVKDKPGTMVRRSSRRVFGLAVHVPGLVRGMYEVASRSRRLRRGMGTVVVTAVGMFAGGGGFAVAPLTLMSLQIMVGGKSERPRVINGEVKVREVLDLTVSVDHDLVDGGPATRFGAELRHQIETTAVLRPDAGILPNGSGHRRARGPSSGDGSVLLGRGYRCSGDVRDTSRSTGR